MIFELFNGYSSFVRGKNCDLFHIPLLDSVIFIHFQTVVVGWKVFQSKKKNHDFPKVSLLGVGSLWGDCTFFRQIGGHSSIFVLFCSF